MFCRKSRVAFRSCRGIQRQKYCQSLLPDLKTDIVTWRNSSDCLNCYAIAVNRSRLRSAGMLYQNSAHGRPALVNKQSTIRSSFLYSRAYIIHTTKAKAACRTMPIPSYKLQLIRYNKNKPPVTTLRL